MEGVDLLALLQHFDKKIDQINQTIPWARFCNQMIKEHDQLHDTPDANGNLRTVKDVPDMNALSGMVIEMESSLQEIENHLVAEKKKLANQEERITILSEDVAAHLEYLSSNFPIDFGKSPEKPKPKYGINTGLANRRQTTATTAKTQPNRAAGAAKPQAKGSIAVKSGQTNSKTVAPTAATNKPKTTTAKPAVDPVARKPTTLPTQPVVGKKAPIPVRMNKAILTAMQHNRNKNN